MKSDGAMPMRYLNSRAKALQTKKPAVAGDNVPRWSIWLGGTIVMSYYMDLTFRMRIAANPPISTSNQADGAEASTAGGATSILSVANSSPSISIASPPA